MKSKLLDKPKFFCECFFEKCMEWIEFLRYGFIERREWISNLSEHYCIHKEYIEKEFVKEFLNERKRILSRNRYKMIIKIIDEQGEKNIVGKVILYRKKKKIHEATLKTKDADTDVNNLIFWSFDN